MNVSNCSCSNYSKTKLFFSNVKILLYYKMIVQI